MIINFTTIKCDENNQTQLTSFLENNLFTEQFSLPLVEVLYFLKVFSLCFILYMKTENIESVSNEIPVQDLSGLSQKFIHHIKGLTAALNQPNIDLRKLRVFLADGVPDQVPLLRQLAWKVILGYLPRARSKWEEQQQKQATNYNEFLKHYLPPERFEDYPLNMTKTHPKWQQYQEDFYLWEQIQKDTSRTQSQLAFFSVQVTPIMIPFLTAARKQKWKLINGEGEGSLQLWNSSKQEQRKTYRYDYMTRILFVFAKANPKVQYVQGMNEVLAPIFYLLNNRKKDKIQEAACFFMFNNVMSDLMQLNISDFDKKENGIHARMREVDRTLLVAQPLVWQKLDELKIDPIYYCFRWLTLLFAQEFQLFQILRIWESIFSCEDRPLYVNCFAVALLSSLRNRILQGTYSSILADIKTIRQHVNIPDVVFHANELYHQLRGLDINTLAKQTLLKLRNKEIKKSKSQKSRIFNKIIKKFL